MRRAVETDAPTLAAMADDTMVILNSGAATSKSGGKSAAAYLAKIKSPGSAVWIAEIDGVPAGQACYDKLQSSAAAEIDISVVESCRGRGLGAAILRETAQAAADILSVDKIAATIFSENTPSVAIFTNAGFEKTAGGIKDGRPFDTFILRRASQRRGVF